MHMFCYQCQETSERSGCTLGGVCGKSEETANYQDLLIYVLKGLGQVARATGRHDCELTGFLFEALYATVTNTNFDCERMLAYVRQGLELKHHLLLQLTPAERARLHEAARFDDLDPKRLHAMAYQVGVLQTEDEDVRSLRELVTYALKGIAAWATHARILGKEDQAIGAFALEALATVAEETSFEKLFDLVLQTGGVVARAMRLLDRANAAAFGEPRATRFTLDVRGRPGILVSGHDLQDIAELLEQTRGTGVDVYTHGEMIAAHYYPKLQAHSHLVGNYGGAWWRQDVEFESFRGPILMTSNCIIPVPDSYRARIFTTGVAGYPGVMHLERRRSDGSKDFSELVELAKRCTPPLPIDRMERTGGFTHGTLVAYAPKLLELIKAGKLKRLIVIGGCDGRDLSREYYRQVAEKLPRDTLILTAGCTKYMFFKLDLGEIEGLPRVLDAGQCNDCYSLVSFALQLKQVLGLEDVNQLPLSVNVAWYDQKAVAALLALLQLGFKGMRLGPTLPAFMSPRVRGILAERYGMKSIGNADADVASMMLGA
jgi:hydroxylamine reductase